DGDLQRRRRRRAVGHGECLQLRQHHERGAECDQYVDRQRTNPCGCATSTGVAGGYGTPPSCTACPDGTTAQTYIVVNTHICYSTLFHWPGLTYCSGSDSNCTGCSSTQLALTAQSAVLK